MRIRNVPILICKNCGKNICSSTMVKNSKKNGCPRCHNNKFVVNRIGIFLISEEIGKIFDDTFQCKKCGKKYCNINSSENVNNVFRGCCKHCAARDGFFDNDIPEYADQLEKLKSIYKFDPDYGFFDNSLPGCKLPYHERSDTCIGHMCSDLYMEVLSNKPLNLISNISFVHLGVEKIVAIRKELLIIT